MSRTRTERAVPRRRCFRVVATALCGAPLLLATGCSDETTGQLKRLGLPEAASDRSPYISHLWIGSWIAALAVGVLVWGLIAYASVRYRRRSDDEIPKQLRYNLPIEMLYTIAPLIVVAVLFYFTIEKQDKVNANVANPDHHVVVTAQQWSWTFNYVGEQSIGGGNVYDAGTIDSEPDLWLVKDQSVNFDLHSPDVIHSFWVPSFYFKMDVIPGKENSFSMTPTRLGTYQGRCAELCGYLHATMRFQVRVVTEAQFNAHMRHLQAAGAVGTLLGGKDSRQVTGIDGGSEGSGQ
ncbi:MAG: aa3-type cytochrome oxidase subunit II [Nocardioidaceae bacterium]